MKITLLCNLGMSTGIMQQSLQAEAAKYGKETDISAHPVAEAEKLKDSDVFLLGPQIAFAEDQVRQAVGPDKIVYVMKPEEFGNMRGDIVFSKVMEMYNEKNKQD